MGLPSYDEVLAIVDSTTAKKEKLYVEFYAREIPDERKTEEFGYAQFKEATYVKIFPPGEGNLNVVDRLASHCGAKRGCAYMKGAPGETPCDVHRFPAQYAAFQGNLDQQEAAGLPLASWPVVNKAQVAMLKAFGVYTVEQLAAVNDSALPQLGPIRSLRQKAIDYIESAKGMQPLQKMRSEIESRDNKIAALENALKEQGDKLQELTEAMAKHQPAPPVVPEQPRTGRRQ